MSEDTFEEDITDNFVVQLSVGAACGYAAGILPDEGSLMTVATGLFVYRLAHKLGFVEVNLIRHPSIDSYGDQAAECTHSPEFLQSFLMDNAYVLGGFAGGYCFAINAMHNLHHG